MGWNDRQAKNPGVWVEGKMSPRRLLNRVLEGERKFSEVTGRSRGEHSGQRGQDGTDMGGRSVAWEPWAVWHAGARGRRRGVGGQVTRSLRVRPGWARTPAQPLPGSVTAGKWARPFVIPVCKFRPWRPAPRAAESLKGQRLSETPGTGHTEPRRVSVNPVSSLGHQGAR